MRRLFDHGNRKRDHEEAHDEVVVRPLEPQYLEHRRGAQGEVGHVAAVVKEGAEGRTVPGFARLFSVDVVQQLVRGPCRPGDRRRRPGRSTWGWGRGPFRTRSGPGG